jgi:predicted nucleic acid-binding protein
LIKLLVDEPGAEEARAAYSEADGIRTTAIAHVEATAALTRMRKGRRLTPTQLKQALEDLENVWQGIYSHAVNDALLNQAAEGARTHALRAYDAVHLAGAIAFAAGEDLDFACWDKELRAAARKEGFPWSLSVFEVKLPSEVSPAPPDLSPEHLEPHAGILLRAGLTIEDAEIERLEAESDAGSGRIVHARIASGELGAARLRDLRLVDVAAARLDAADAKPRADQPRAAARRRRPGEDPQQGRLAAPVGPARRGDRPRRHREVNLGQHPGSPDPVPLGGTTEGDQLDVSDSASLAHDPGVRLARRCAGAPGGHRPRRPALHLGARAPTVDRVVTEGRDGRGGPDA